VSGRDYYEVLGLTRQASDADVKRAFRDLARRYHPDGNPGDHEAEERFKEISIAYETLGDPERRRRYDVFGEGAPRAGGAQSSDDPFGFGDIFDAFFGGDAFGMRRGPSGPARGPDAEAVVELDLAAAAFGATASIDVRLPVACSRCEGSGCDPGTHPSRCDECGGSGEVRQVRRSILGQVVTAAPCSACEGTGRRILSPCRDCRGDGRVLADRTIEVEVPAGVDDGQRLRLSGRGAAAPRGGQAGDLYVTIRVEASKEFERQGEHLVRVQRISVAQAALGAVVAIPTLEDDHELTVPAGTQPGQVFRVKGAGVPSLRGRGRGDLMVRIEVEVPTKMRDDEAALFLRLAELRGEDVAPPEKGVLSKLRSAFQ
jgi:molecular chaperone DnaJ